MNLQLELLVQANPNMAGRRWGRRKPMFLPWKMPSVCQYRHLRLLFSEENTKKVCLNQKAFFPDDSIVEDDDEEVGAGDVSLPNLVNLAVSTPTKSEVKTEPTSMSSAPQSLPVMATEQDRKRARSPNLFQTESEPTESITLQSETRSLDTNDGETTAARTPTPMAISPPQKVRRSTRNTKL